MKISYFNNENMSVSNTIKAGPLRGKRIKTRLLPTQGLFQHDYLSNEEAFILLGNTLYYYLSDINEGEIDEFNEISYRTAIILLSERETISKTIASLPKRNLDLYNFMLLFNRESKKIFGLKIISAGLTRDMARSKSEKHNAVAKKFILSLRDQSPKTFSLFCTVVNNMCYDIIMKMNAQERKEKYIYK